MAKTCLATVLLLALAGLLFFVLEPGQELGAQNERWTAVSHDKTNFPLLGKHRSVTCGDCHLNGVIAGTPKDCEACHWVRRQDDPYKLYFGIHCADCHTPFDWKKLKANSWEHGQAAGFPLAGVHKTMDCTACHPDKNFKGQTQECYSCHRQQYEQAPHHVSANYSTDCRLCHFSMTTWSGAQTGHASFPLVGRHAAAACADCHKNNVYTGTSQACVSCHLQEYNSTQNPNHKLAGYSTDCVSCHGASAQNWTDAVVNHDQYWPLQGVHKTIVCSQCHSAGYDLPRDCYGCHRADYEKTTSPNHRQAGYSTDCASCHGSTALTWKNAAVNHDQYWPLLGAHRNLDCSKCHSAGYDLPRDCYGCHRANYDNTTNPNHRQAGYSTVCENCHFASHISWTQAVFTHRFPIKSGKHAGFACTDCHLSSNYLVFSCIDCHTHSKSTVDSKHHDVGGYAYNSQACYSCHSDGRAGVGIRPLRRR
jgi:hypothetical protein